MRFSVEVKNSKTKSPVPDATVVLFADDKKLHTIYTDESGKTEHVDQKLRTGKMLSWIVEAEGFKDTRGERDISASGEEGEEVAVEIELEKDEEPFSKEEVEERSDVELTIYTVDKQGAPVEGAVVAVNFEGQQLGQTTTNPSGKAVFSLSLDHTGKKVVYSAKHANYLLAHGECELQELATSEVCLQEKKQRSLAKWLLGAAFVVGAMVVAWPIIGPDTVEVPSDLKNGMDLGEAKQRLKEVGLGFNTHEDTSVRTPGSAKLIQVKPKPGTPLRAGDVVNLYHSSVILPSPRPPTGRVRPGEPPPPTVRVRPGEPPPPTVRVRPSEPPPPTVRVRPGEPPPPTVRVRPAEPPLP